MGVLGLASCARHEAQAAEARRAPSFLSRSPDAVSEQLGVIELSTLSWDAYGREGWERAPLHWTNTTKAGVILPALLAYDRTLVLMVRGPRAAGTEPRRFGLILNGVRLGEFNLPRTLSEVAVAAPKAAWRENQENLLEFEVPQLVELEPGRPVGVGVARITYGRPFCVTLDPAHEFLSLAAGTSVTYDFEELGPTDVLLQVAARGPGILEWSIHALDPVTGAQTVELSALKLPLVDQTLERALPTSGPEGTLRRMRLRWTSNQPWSELLVKRLERREEEPRRRPSIVFISIDSLAAKHLELYGYPRETAPNLTRFAAEATTFDYCLSNATWTVPSYMSVLTGHYARAHRLTHEGSMEEQPWERWHLAENRWTLAEAMRGAGYATAAFVDHDWLVETFGFHQGFEVFDTSAAGGETKTDPEGGIRKVARAARAWLESLPRETPYFLFLHALDVHGPYTAPPPFNERFAGDGLYDPNRTAPAAGNSDVYGVLHGYQILPELYPGLELPARLPTAPFADRYDQGIAFVDDELGRFLEFLRGREDWKDSLVVISADHGETMDDRDYLFGHGVLDEAVVHVPLVARFPEGRGAGQRVAAGVQLVDLYPTILDVVGLGSRLDLHGRSVLPLLEGPESAARTLYTEDGLMNQRAVVRDGWKLVEQLQGSGSSPGTLLSLPNLAERWTKEILPWALEQEHWADTLLALAQQGEDPLALFERIGREGLHTSLDRQIQANPVAETFVDVLRDYLSRPTYALYHLAEDPEGRADLSAEHPELVAELLEAMNAERERMREVRTHALAPSKKPELSEAALETLRRLGYVGE